MPAPRRRKSRPRSLLDQVRQIANRLRTLSFDRDPWDGTLTALQSAFGSVVACRYLPERVENRWSFDSMVVAVDSNESPQEFRRRILPIMSSHLEHRGFYDLSFPHAQQRNRAMLLSEIPRTVGRTLAEMQELMSQLGLSRWDQLRVLVCDGARLSSWLGLLSEHRFGERERTALQELVPACQARLRFEQLSHHAEQANATLEATLEAVPAPCFLLHSSGRVLDANAAGRLLREVDRELFTRISRLPRDPDPLFELHPVKVRGVTVSYLATLRLPSLASSKPLLERARSWRLTDRQTTVLACLAKGLANKEIASQLNIALGTVELHVSAILAKARVDSRSALLAAYWDPR